MHKPGSDTVSKLEMSFSEGFREKKREFIGNHSYLFNEKIPKAKLTIIKQTTVIYCPEV